MNVDFGGGDAFVAEHLLYGTEVCAPFEEVCGEGVAKGVWTDFFAYPCKFGKLLDDIENHYACQSASTAVEKQYVFFARFDIEVTTVIEIKLYLVYGSG